MSRRSAALADRLEEGARALAVFASELTDSQWHAKVPGDGRTIGVIVHHVATMYPLEIELALRLADGQPVVGVTWAVVHKINADHAAANQAVTREAALERLLINASAAAAAVRGLSDDELDQAGPVSLNAGAPLTCQFLLEDHAVRHSYHHLAAIKSAVAEQQPAAVAG